MNKMIFFNLLQEDKLNFLQENVPTNAGELLVSLMRQDFKSLNLTS